MKRTLAILVIVVLGISAHSGKGWPFIQVAVAQARSLDIYFVDVEGGGATLIVTPAGESVLIDSGWARDDHRDAQRILEVAVRQAKLAQIDHYITTHWHRDHFGGIGRLSELLPVKNFYHHGIPENLAEDRQHFPVLMAAYQKAAKGQSRVLQPGDDLPLAIPAAQGAPALRLRCVAAHGNLIEDKPPAPANALCKDHQAKAEDLTDNARSIAMLLTFGPFRFFDGGDLTWNKEKDLVCPSNKVGRVEVYQVNHHGMATSNNPVLLRSLNPRVAVFNNGPRKGGDASVYAALRALPEIKSIYAVHRNVQTTEKDNPPREYIANWEEACRGEFVKLSVDPTGKSYRVAIGPQGPPHRYKTRSH